MVSRLSAILSVAVLFISGCASKNPNLSIQAEARIGKEDLREIHEAFKNSSQEKRIELMNSREAVCAYTQCGIAMTLEGPVENSIKDGEKAKLTGYLVFTKNSSTTLLELIDRARGFGKEHSSKGPKGSAECNSKQCTLRFSLKDKLHIAVDSLISELPDTP